jgi:hypothetical protein
LRPRLLGRCKPRGNIVACPRIFIPGWNEKEDEMPIFIMWALPAAIILAGGTYFVFLR